MKFVFRTDASMQIGSGHVMRCLTLADGLRDKGAEILFVCRDLPGNLNCLIEEKGFNLSCLPAPENGTAKLDWNRHAPWLGVGWRQDAVETLACLQGFDEPVDLLVVDHYALDRQWEALMRPLVGKIMVIDDLADREHDCDLLLDQNLYPDMELRYQNLLPIDCKLLVGPDWVLLRPEFEQLRKQMAARDGHVRRILVFMGGSDLDDVTSTVLNALKNLSEFKLEVDVVVGTNSPNRSKVEATCKEVPCWNFHSQVANLADFMCRADLAIGGGGTTTWERCCLKLPTLIVSIADNQTAIAQGVADVGAAYFIGELATVDEQKIFRAISEMTSTPETLKRMGDRAGQLVDALGTQRVVGELVGRP